MTKTDTEDHVPGRMKMEFEYCPSCAGDLDTGFECNKCGRDWQLWATMTVTESEAEQ